MTALIDVSSVSKKFGELSAVEGVSLVVQPGEVVGLLGANGAGKSTLIRIILGLIRPTTGRIRLFGDAPSRAGRARLGYVPQSTGLYLDLTVAENLSFVSAAFHGPPPRLDPKLEEVADRQLSAVSLGLRRRTAFVAALSHDPELLVLDEPTSGVGPLGRAELWSTIGHTAGHGVGVLVTTHHMEEAEQCDRILMLSSGRLVAEGTAKSIVESVKSVEVQAGDWQGAFSALESAGFHPSLVGTRLRVTGVGPERIDEILISFGINAEVRPVRAGFEEAFVSLATG